MSWLTTKFITHQLTEISALESLKASALGLGLADCQKQFRCDVHVMLQERNNRRRKRSIETFEFEWNI